MRKEKKEDNTIEIVEDVRLPNSDIILEKGDKIKIISEMIYDPEEEEYYERVAEYFTEHWNIHFELEELELEDEERKILFKSNQGDTIEITQSWSEDGSSEKPVTFLDVYMSSDQMSEELGRYAIWDDPKEYGEDLAYVIDQQI